MDCDEPELTFFDQPLEIVGGCMHCAGIEFEDTDFDTYCEPCMISYLSDRCRTPTRSINHLPQIKCVSCDFTQPFTSDFLGLCQTCLIVQNTVNLFTGNTPSERVVIQETIDYYMGNRNCLVKYPIGSKENEIQQQIKAFFFVKP